MPACDAFVACEEDELRLSLTDCKGACGVCGRLHGRFLSCTRAFVYDRSCQNPGQAWSAVDRGTKSSQGSCKSRRRI